MNEQQQYFYNIPNDSLDAQKKYYVTPNMNQKIPYPVRELRKEEKKSNIKKLAIAGFALFVIAISYYLLVHLPEVEADTKKAEAALKEATEADLKKAAEAAAKKKAENDAAEAAIPYYAKPGFTNTIPYTTLNKCLLDKSGSVDKYYNLDSKIDGNSILNWANSGEGRFQWPGGMRNSAYLWDLQANPKDNTSAGSKFGRIDFVECPTNLLPAEYTNSNKCLLDKLSSTNKYYNWDTTAGGTTLRRWVEIGTSRFRGPNGYDKTTKFLWDMDNPSRTTFINGNYYGVINFVDCPTDKSLISKEF
jgi:hypothetical protein